MDFWSSLANSLASLPVTIIAGDAVENNTADTSAVAGNTSDDESSACTSIAGDTFAIDSVAETGESDTEVVARRERRLRPLMQCFQSLDIPAKQISGVRIRDICGVFYANWGFIRTSGDAQARGQVMRRQLRKAPAQILIVAEARKSVVEVLLEPRRSGDVNATGLAARDSWDWWVVRGNEEEAALLIAARKSTCPCIRMLGYEVHPDHKFKQID